MFAMQYGHILYNNCSVVVILSAFAKIHYKLTLSIILHTGNMFSSGECRWLWKEPVVMWVGWLWKELVNYWSSCSNWWPFAFTHARSRAVHWSTASSTTHCGMLEMCQRGASSGRLCHGPASCTDAAASGPKCGNRLGLGPGCFL